MIKLLVEISIKDTTKLDQLTRIYRGFSKAEYILNTLKRECKGVKKTAFNTSLHDRLMNNGKARTGDYYIKLYNKTDHPAVIEQYEEYVRSQLPTFEEYILAMRDRYCPDLEVAKKLFAEFVSNDNAVDFLGNRLVELQETEAEVIMWRKLIGKKWSIIDAKVEKGITSKELHKQVCLYLNEVGNDIIDQTSFGVASSSNLLYNVLENAKYETVAKWYRHYVSEIRSLVEGHDYR